VSKGERKPIRSAVSITLGRGLRAAWLGMLRHFEEQFGDWPAVPSSHSSANDSTLADLMEREQPDLVLISGTDLLRQATLERYATKVMNLHTGISPYIRGGPNCANWALALGEFDLIGNTVMWIDPGIDSGAIIATERTPLTGRETLSELPIRVMDHAHDLYRRAVEAFANGRPLPSLPQKSIAKGRLFLTRHWISAAMLRAGSTTGFAIAHSRSGRTSSSSAWNDPR
jgi:folate-dependent phosphoribosylglycinamide formyltransferase PurN